MLNNVLGNIMAKEWFMRINKKNYTIRFEELNGQILMINCSSDRIMTFAEYNSIYIDGMKDGYFTLKGLKIDILGECKTIWKIYESEETYNKYKTNNKLINRVMSKEVLK